MKTNLNQSRNKRYALWLALALILGMVILGISGLGGTASGSQKARVTADLSLVDESFAEGILIEGHPNHLDWKELKKQNEDDEVLEEGNYIIGEIVQLLTET